MRMLIKWDSHGIFYGIFVIFYVFFVKNETELELKWDFDGMDMWF